MNCYNHTDRNAVGICPTCHKGICHECGTKAEIFSCNKTSCIEYMNKISRIIDSNDEIVKINENVNKKTAKVIKRSFITEVILGLFLITVGISTYFADPLLGLIFMGFGLIFIGYAIYSLISKLYRLDKK